MVGAEILRLTVAEVIQETEDACSFVLMAEDGCDLDYRAGQFLTVRLPSDLTGHVARSYSLSSAPGREAPKVTVKRVADGYASNYMCDQVRAGEVLEFLRPAGVFTPSSLDADHLLIAAGSGVTPVMSILKTILHRGSGRVVLVYANRDERSVIFAEELRELSETYADRLVVLHWLESVQGLPTGDRLRALLAPYADVEAFICGPVPFMDAAAGALHSLGTSPEQVHVERFISLTGDPFGSGSVLADGDEDADGPVSTVEVVLEGEKQEVAWPGSANLLDVLLAAGIDAPYSCREGACSACACVVTEGEVTMLRNEVLLAEDIADGIVLACQARPASDYVRISYDA